MKILLENGGEINKGDRYGKTPLHWAAGTVVLIKNPLQNISVRIASE